MFIFGAAFSLGWLGVIRVGRLVVRVVAAEVGLAETSVPAGLGDDQRWGRGGAGFECQSKAPAMIGVTVFGARGRDAHASTGRSVDIATRVSCQG